MPVNARESTGTSRDKAGTSRDKQGHSLSVPTCPCLSLSAHACPCFTLSVPVCPCLSMLVPASPCMTLSVPVLPCPSLSIPVYLYICFTFMSTPEMNITVFITMSIVTLTGLAIASVQCMQTLSVTSSFLFLLLPQ